MQWCIEEPACVSQRNVQLQVFSGVLRSLLVLKLQNFLVTAHPNHVKIDFSISELYFSISGILDSWLLSCSILWSDILVLPYTWHLTQTTDFLHHCGSFMSHSSDMIHSLKLKQIVHVYLFICLSRSHVISMIIYSQKHIGWYRIPLSLNLRSGRVRYVQV